MSTCKAIAKDDRIILMVKEEDYDDFIGPLHNMQRGGFTLWHYTIEAVEGSKRIGLVLIPTIISVALSNNTEKS